MDVPCLNGSSGICSCSGAAADKRALLIAPLPSQEAFITARSTTIWLEFLQDFTARVFLFFFFFLADKLEKEGEKGVMAGNGGRQIFPTQIKKLESESRKSKKKKNLEKLKMQKGCFVRLLFLF